MKRILVVDDERDIREILKDFLEDLGEVVSVENGALALEQLQKGHFDLVISDYNMPEMNGMQLLKKLNELGIKTPLVWITGRSTKELLVDAWREGVFDYIEKPFDLEQVRKSVITALSMEIDTFEVPDARVEIPRSSYDRAVAHAQSKGISVGDYVNALILKDLGTTEQ